MGADTSGEHAVKHLVFPEASVKTVAKLSQVTGKMFFTDAMINSADIAFDIGNQGMNPREQLHRIFSRTGNHRLMLVGYPFKFKGNTKKDNGRN